MTAQIKHYDPIPLDLIERQFLNFLCSRSDSLAPVDSLKQLKFDQVTRYKVAGDKGSETSGTYKVFTNKRPAAFIHNHRTGEHDKWVFDFDELKGDKKYEKIVTQIKDPEWLKFCEAEDTAREAEAQANKLKAFHKAKVKWETAKPLIQPNHPYLLKKQVKSYDLKIDDKGNLLIALRNVDGDFQSLQTIDKDGHKKFEFGLSTNGLIIPLDMSKAKDTKQPILICEGYATGATLAMLTGLPTACALNCHNILKVAPLLRKKYPKNKIIIMADNDFKTAGNPGITSAQEAAEITQIDGIFWPEFQDVGDGSDWNDYYIKYGEQATAKILKDYIAFACMSKEEQNKQNKLLAVKSVRVLLNKEIRLPQQEVIAGMFPRDYISIIAAAPGIGKTWCVQKLISDLSLGGSVFNGFAYEPRPIKSLTFTGETGDRLLLRRAAATQWPVNINNAVLYDQDKCFDEGIDLYLDSEAGFANFEMIVMDEKPDIIFVDSFISFYSADESKVEIMNKTFRQMRRVTQNVHAALVPTHHLRKRKTSDRNAPITLDELIGTSAIIRFASSIIAIEPERNENVPENERVNIVRQLKSWDRKFTPFSFKIIETDTGLIDMDINLDPPQAPSARSIIWDYIKRTYQLGEWFRAEDLKEVSNVGQRQIRRILDDFIKQRKLQERGETKGKEYALWSLYTN